MFGFSTLDIADNERGFLFRRNRFVKVLEPGRYRINIWSKERAEIFDTQVAEFDHTLGKILFSTQAHLVQGALQGITTGGNSIALVFLGGKLANVIGPGSFKMYWKGVEDITVTQISLDDKFEVDGALRKTLAHPDELKLRNQINQFFMNAEVPEQHVGLLQVDGKIDRVLNSGAYGFWKYNRNVNLHLIDCRWQNLDISGQEILTKDRVSLRINLSGTYKVFAPEKAATRLAKYMDFMYREMQLQLREAVGTQTLDALLADKDALNQRIEEGVSQRLMDVGISLKSVGVKDIILPGDMKMILNQVVEAQKLAEANLIKRREETAATRSLHNTAKVMEGNETLMRLKELEVLERVTDRINNLTVYGGLDGVMTELVKLKN